MKFYSKTQSAAGSDHKTLKNDRREPGSFYIYALGCQQNEYDASRLAFFLKSLGLEESDEKTADYIFVVACSVRETAVDRVYGHIRNHKNQKVIVTSCVNESDKKKFIDRGAIYWEFGDLKSLKSVIPGLTRNLKIPDQVRDDKLLPYSDTSYVPIMTGCDNFCSYCIVPYLRGREKSRSMNDIIVEAANLIKSGKKEIILLGQNVNSYKIIQKSKFKSQNCNSKVKIDFVVLLEKLNALPGEFKISFLSNHPKDMTEDLIEAIANLPKIKKEIHLPLQSGSDKILKAMNRPYTSEQYYRLVQNLKFKISNLKLTTDIIVGYPGETEEDFQKTVELCKKINFKQAFVNKYSPREGTAAYKLGDPISWQEKQHRWRILNDLIYKK